MASTKILIAALALAGACLRAVAAPPASEPIANGPAIEPRVHFEFAIYYPTHPAIEPMTALRRHLAAAPSMPHLVDRVSMTGSATEVHAEWMANAARDYEPPSLEMIKIVGRGLSPGQAQALTQAGEALRLDFAHPAKDRLGALRNAQILVEQLARETNGLVWDDETREPFTPDAWHATRVQGWEGDLPEMSRQTIVHVYAKDGHYRCVSLGMIKFGEPDIVVEDVAASDSTEAVNIINVLSQALVEGATSDAKGQLTIRLQQSRHPEVNRKQGLDLKPNAERAARLLLVRGEPERGDADNRLLRIAFDRYDAPDEHARQAALMAGLFGSTDGVTHVQHDARLIAARDAARAHLPQLREIFNKGLAPGEYIDVKAPFDSDSGGREWMWVEVSAWKGDRIEGTLQNTPDDVKRLRVGQDVVVSQADLFDYIFHRADGRVEGNTTGAIIQEAERAAH